MKLSKENFGWIFTSVGLAILLALSIYLGLSGWYFENDRSFTTDIELGKTVQIGVDKNQANAISFNLDGSFLSGERLPQLVSIKNMDEIEDVYLRAKIYIYSGTNQTLEMNMVETVNWVYNESDGYFISGVYRISEADGRGYELQEASPCGTQRLGRAG